MEVSLLFLKNNVRLSHHTVEKKQTGQHRTLSPCRTKASMYVLYMAQVISMQATYN